MGAALAHYSVPVWSSQNIGDVGNMFGALGHLTGNRSGNAKLAADSEMPTHLMSMRRRLRSQARQIRLGHLCVPQAQARIWPIPLPAQEGLRRCTPASTC